MILANMDASGVFGEVIFLSIMAFVICQWYCSMAQVHLGRCYVGCAYWGLFMKGCFLDVWLGCPLHQLGMLHVHGFVG